ncbi:hypothetical protein PENSPDRAFT_602475 [Peniophora sp. CONT]|nr:hypothetical protein PENSPDRAFT_602475 [Peniophora sp. CONT]
MAAATASPTSPAVSQLSRAPSYDVGAHPPAYGGAHHPQPTESRPRETFVRKNDIVTVVLQDVQVDARSARPTYGRGDTIRGEVGLATTNDVSSVVARLEGRMKIRLGDLTSTHHTFVDVPVSLGAASSVLPFTLTIPETFTDRDDGLSYPLVPSLDIQDRAEAYQDELRVRVAYRLIVSVGRGNLHLQKSVEVDLNYEPRSPQNWQMPAPAARPNFAETKEIPLGWQTIATQVKAAPPSTIETIDCTLYAPSSETFSIRDKTPFTLLLQGPSASMRELFVPTVPPKLRKKEKSEHFPPPTIRISVKRQVVCSLQSITLAHSFIIGEGSLRMGTPGYANPGEARVLYEGEIECPDSVKYAAFATNKITVSDFLVLSVAPHNPYFSEFAALNHTIPLKTVTG